ncbi:MAG: metal-dependent hydrolase [Gammaproteobacteria bacterium]|nr:metal-dependent hydrolase [Gammaproteobacteria bacterium]
MDIVTQGLLGGVLAQAVATKNEKKIATFVGIVAGLLADVDIFISSSSDPLLNLEFHRHFTHSLLFIPIGAAIAWLILWPLLHRHINKKRLYLFALAGFSMSGVLDACTSYGTHLFWPFTDERVSLSIIAIIDPVFSLILLTTLLLGLHLQHRQLAYGGLTLCMVYLSFGFIQQQRAEQLANELRTKRGHTTEQQVIKPTLANLLLWRSVYVHEQRIYVDALRVGLFSKQQVFTGESVQKFSLQQDMPALDTTTPLYKDIQRFTLFSDDFVAYDPTQRNILGDMRYSMLPTSTKPLWGISIDKNYPQRHSDYRVFRDRSKNVRLAFINMLSGKCATAVC